MLLAGRFPLLLTDAEALEALEARADWVLEAADRMLWGNRVVPESGRMLPVPFLMSICLIAMSSDFFEMVLPKPVLSEDVVEVFTGFREGSVTCEAFRDSGLSATWPLECRRPLALGSETLPLVTIGDDCLLVGVSEFPFMVMAAPGRDLPAERGLSGKVVLRFGGVSSGKSGRTIGCGGFLTRGLGELGREAGAGLRPFDIARAVEGDGPAVGDKEAAGVRRVGVDGREFDRAAGELKFAWSCGLELGVVGLEFGDGRGLSMEELVRPGRALEGVEDLDDVGRADGVEGLAVDEERVMGEDGLV